MSRRPEMLAADHIRELIRPHTTSELIHDGTIDTRIHTVTHLPLLDQIRDTITTSQTAGQPFSSAYGSKPAGRIDCLAYLERLDRQSRAMATELDIPLLPLTRRLERISGAIGYTTNRTVRAWWATARVLTQHDGPPYSPNVPCPVESCEQRGTLRLRIDERVGVCVDCHTVWSDDTSDDTMTFGRLAIWVQWAAEHLSGLRHWVPATLENSGYDQGLGYLVECPTCWPERLARHAREADRLRAVRQHRRMTA